MNKKKGFFLGRGSTFKKSVYFYTFIFFITVLFILLGFYSKFLKSVFIHTFWKNINFILFPSCLRILITSTT